MEEKSHFLSNEESSDELSFEHFRFQVDGGQSPLRVDKYLVSKIEGRSRNSIQLAIKAQFVSLNGKKIKANHIVRPNDTVVIELPYQKREFEIIPQEIPLEIIYEDNQLMVINKRAGMVVHPGHGNYSGTLLNALAYHLNLKGEQSEGDNRMGVLVHRIDKNTSGLLLAAKDEITQYFLAQQFFEKSVERRYLALVWGNLKNEGGTIEGNIGRDPKNRLKFKVFEDGSEGKNAVTHYRVIERFGYTTLIECSLETGRTHQIRVHMDWIGHPLFNDDRYGGDRVLKGRLYGKYKEFVENSFALIPGQALHARDIGFIHPISRERMLFSSKMPPSMEQVVERWRKFSQTNG
ncbi:MAG: RluA family pseudouridine synthase [Bacteroidales bacterium]